MQDVQQSVSDDLKKQKNQHKLIQLNLLMKLGKMQQLRTQYTLLSESVAPARRVQEPNQKRVPL